jgi:hypothetical protein
VLTGQARLDDNREGTLMLVVLTLALAFWLFTALRTGRTFDVSSYRLPRMVDRQSDPLGFWSMIVFIGFVLSTIVVLGVWVSVAN